MTVTEQEHQDFRLQNDREWRAKVDHQKALADERFAEIQRGRKIIEGLAQFREWVLTKAVNADEINLILAENARVENSELANGPFLAVQIAEAIDARIQARPAE